MTNGTTVKERSADPAFLCIPSLGVIPPFAYRVVSVSFSTSGLMFAFSFTKAQVVWKHLA